MRCWRSQTKPWWERHSASSLQRARVPLPPWLRPAPPSPQAVRLPSVPVVGSHLRGFAGGPGKGSRPTCRPPLPPKNGGDPSARPGVPRRQVCPNSEGVASFVHLAPFVFLNFMSLVHNSPHCSVFLLTFQIFLVDIIHQTHIYQVFTLNIHCLQAFLGQLMVKSMAFSPLPRTYFLLLFILSINFRIFPWSHKPEI